MSSLPFTWTMREASKKFFPAPAQLTFDNPEWHESYLDRMVQMMQRDKNPPSIFSWPRGNKSSYIINHIAMVKYAQSVDDRLFDFEGDINAQETGNDSYIYADQARLKRHEEVDSIKDDKWAVILCEYAHAMGNSAGGLGNCQEAFRKYEGFITVLDTRVIW